MKNEEDFKDVQGMWLEIFWTIIGENIESKKS